MERIYKQTSDSLSLDSQRVFTQDLNIILRMLYEDNKIGKIRLKPPIRKFSSSEGFHVEKLLDFTYEDIVKLWNVIKNGDNEEFALLFMLVICCCTPANHLIHLTVSGIRRDLIEIRNGGLICSVLLEPGKTLLLRYIVRKGLKKSDRIFGDITQAAFTKWLKRQCWQASVRNYIERAFYFARFLIVLQGIPAYQIACLGSKMPFRHYQRLLTERMLRMSSETKKLIKEYCIYVNRDTVRLSDENDFHLTADIDTFWRISDENDSFVGLVSSYISLDLNKLFSEVHADIVIHSGQHEIYEVLLFALNHIEHLDRMFILENTSKKPIPSKKWISDVTVLERKKGKACRHTEKGYYAFSETA